MRPVPWILLAACVAVISCTRASPLYCDENTPCPDRSIPFCDLYAAFQDNTNRCIENPFGSCQLPSECSESAAPVCDQFIGCAPCTAVADGDAACVAANPATPVCEASGRCGGCAQSSDCDVVAPICDESSRTCSPCSPGAPGNIDCASRDTDAPFCTQSGTCGECLGDADCTDALAEFCGDDGFCRGCIENSECESGVCDRTKGTCVAEDDIAYVFPLATGDCSRADPCGRIGGPGGALAVKNIVKLAAGSYAENDLTLTGGARIVGDVGAVVSGMVASTFAQVSGGAGIEDLTWNGSLRAVGQDGEVALYLKNVVIANEVEELIRVASPVQVEIDDCLLTSSTQRLLYAASGTTIIRNSIMSSTASSALIIDGGSVQIRSSVIEDSVRALDAPLGELIVSESEIRNNTGVQAVWLAGANYDFRNNWIWGNGGSGIEIAGEPVSKHVFSFNTVVANGGTGVICYPGGFAASNNIVRGNTVAQVGGGCAWSYSNIQGGSAGEGNIDEDPRFVAPGSGDFHLQPSSPCVGAGDPSSSNSTDIDGDYRPYGGAFDIGADELRP